MEFKLYDNGLILDIAGNRVTYNNQTIISEEIVSKIHEYLMNNLECISNLIYFLAAKDISINNIPRINFYDEYFLDETIQILGNSEKEEVANLYKNMKQYVLDIVESYFN